MAKDDYYVIVYQILSYLYQCLKKGVEVDEEMLKPKNLYDINEKYWIYIMEHMQQEGFVEGVDIHQYIGGEKYVDFSDVQITPAGIGYLLDNNLMAKAQKFLKNIKEIIPFSWTESASKNSVCKEAVEGISTFALLFFSCRVWPPNEFVFIIEGLGA